MAVYPSGGVMPSSWQMSALYILVAVSYTHLTLPTT